MTILVSESKWLIDDDTTSAGSENHDVNGTTSSNNSSSSTSPYKVPLAYPSRLAPKGHIPLIKVAAQRQSLLNSSARPSRHRVRAVSSSSTSLPNLLLSCVFNIVNLSLLRFTLDVFVYQQYAQSVEWNVILLRSAYALLFFIPAVYVAKLYLPVNVSAEESSKVNNTSISAYFASFVWFVISVSCGARLVHITYTSPYIAVMKHAPALGTLWIWSVVESSLTGSLLSSISLLAWFRFMGYASY